MRRAVMESKMAKVLRLAAVRGYRRVERGREQVVRSYTENRPAALPVEAPSRSPRMPGSAPEGARRPGADRGWIPESKWKAGQKEWVGKGEAAWKAGGARWSTGAVHEMRVKRLGRLQDMTEDQATGASIRHAMDALMNRESEGAVHSHLGAAAGHADKQGNSRLANLIRAEQGHYHAAG